MSDIPEEIKAILVNEEPMIKGGGSQRLATNTNQNQLAERYLQNAPAASGQKPPANDQAKK